MKTYKIMTQHGVLEYLHDYEHTDGGVRMLNAKTINRYYELTNDHANCEQFGVFFAFTRARFDQGYKSLVKHGFIKDGDKIQQAGSGLYGSKESLADFYAWYDKRDKLIAEECDPQEVYFYEYNNHECMYGWDGDTEPMKIVTAIFGEEAAAKIHRITY